MARDLSCPKTKFDTVFLWMSGWALLRMLLIPTLIMKLIISILLSRTITVVVAILAIEGACLKAFEVKSL